MLAMPAPADGGGGGGIDWGGLEAEASEQASEWTETKKDLFLIRINFSDNLADPVSKAAAEASMIVASDQILAMSYGKTWVVSAASTNLYTLPQTAAHYANGGVNGLNSDLIRDARNTFRANKSGADAAINIGPVSNNTNGDGGGLGGYQIVGITFSSIGMTSGTVLYAGLASNNGGNLWMQGNNSASVYTHEWGHNYGLSHASSWDTTDGSVVGAGASTEYGDLFDIMGDGKVPQGHFHPQGKSKLNWLTSTQWTDATASGSATHRVHRIDDPSTTSTTKRGLRITKSATPGSEEYYWLGYRPAYAENNYLQKGAYLNWQQPATTKCWVLDTTPGSTDGKKDGSVDIGRTYADTAANVFVTPLSTGGTGADRYLDVRVNLGPFPGNNAPAANPISGPATLAARTSGSYSFSATDGDADPLAYWWNMQNGIVNDNAASISTTWTVGGTYSVTAVASDMKGGQGTVIKAVTVTDPIDTWTQHSTGDTAPMRAAVWGKGRFVAASYWGAVYLSWDGATWSSVADLPAFDREPVVAFGANCFVIGGKRSAAGDGQIYYSVDGRIWQAATFPVGVPQIRSIAFGGGKFVAVADDGTVLTSPNGSTWTGVTVGDAPDFRRVTWDGTTWLAIARNATDTKTSVVWTSLNGTSWSLQTDIGSDITAVFGRNGMVMATGWYVGVKYSTDHGLTWKNASLPSTSRWSTEMIAAADDGTLLLNASEMDVSGSPDFLLISTDGIHWVRSNASAGATVADLAQAITFGAGRFLTVEDNGVTRRCETFYPGNQAPVANFTANPATMPARETRLFMAAATDADGDPLTYSWDFDPQLAMSDGSSTVRSFNFGGSYSLTLRVSDGRGGLTVLNHAVTVTDPARTFTQRTSGTTKELRSIAANSSVAVAIGGNGGLILTSPDGVTWTTRTISSSTNITFRGATWDGAKFIIAGTDYNFTAPAGWQGTIYTSPDGTTWTRRYGSTNRGDELQAVASDGTGAVAVGNSGTVLSSADGLSWSPVTVSGAPGSFDGIAWHDGYVAVGGASGTSGTPKVFTSTDRVNWMDTTAGSGLDSWQDMNKVVWLNDRFVGSGWYSKVRVSTDGGATFTTTRSTSEQNPALAYGDGIYFTAGVQLDAPSADVDVLSLDGVSWQSFAAPTAENRNAATFFKHTFITVGVNGSIWQSGDVTPTGSSNTAPTFAGYAIATPYETAAAVSHGKLLTAAADANGDALFVTAAGTASAQGGTASLLTGMVLYTPPAGFSGTDTIPVIITDARGGTVAGTITVTVQSNTGIGTNPPTITMLPSGSAKIDFQGIPGRSYEVQRSTDLTVWQTIATPTADVHGAVVFIDETPPPGSAFYRMRKP